MKERIAIVEDRVPKGIITRVNKVGDEYLVFENGYILNSDHEQSCCESHYLDFEHINLSDFDGLEFNLSDENFFTRIDGYGISLNPINGLPVRIPGYGSNNGYYSSNLSLMLTDSNNKLVKEWDITECQDY